MSESAPHAHQFDDAAQQHEAATLGMWTFLATEVLFFGGLFLGYAAYRHAYPEAFSEASHHLLQWAGGVNTAVLLLSSLTMALAVHAAQHGHRKPLIGYLLATMVLGSIFLGIKAFEYYVEYEEQLIPGLNFRYEGPLATQVALFMTFYFVMTALHATHMIIGIAVVGVIAIMAWRGRFSDRYYNPVEMTGLYWHFVDIVWIFLFPLLYLIH